MRCGLSQEGRGLDVLVFIDLDDEAAMLPHRIEWQARPAARRGACVAKRPRQTLTALGWSEQLLDQADDVSLGPSHVLSDSARVSQSSGP